MFQQATKPLFKVAAAAVLAILVPGTPSPALAQTEPFLAEMMYISFNFAPKGWALCNGQTLPINQNQALFSLLGTTYGGDGRVNFQLPNMQGRAPLHFGSNGSSTYYTQGQVGGSQTATLIASNLPSHAHSVSLSAQIPVSSANATVSTPAGNGLANTVHSLSYASSAPNVSLSSAVTVSGTTGSAGTASPQPFSTMPPYLTVNCVIALQGIFPSRN